MLALDTPMRTRSTAFSVAFSFSCECTHEHCSRRLTMWRRYGFRPACLMQFLKVGSCSLGEQDATTTFSTPCSLMALMISSWPRSEQVYLFSFATTTPGSFSAASLTFPQSTTPAMLLPQ